MVNVTILDNGLVIALSGLTRFRVSAKIFLKGTVWSGSAFVPYSDSKVKPTRVNSDCNAHHPYRVLLIEFDIQGIPKSVATYSHCVAVNCVW